MLKFYPSHGHLVNQFRQLCSQHFGIMESQLLMAGHGKQAPHLAMFSSNMPNYHKLVVNERATMSYHLSGYGMYNEEALIRLLGEGIERYALVVSASILEARIFWASYDDLTSDAAVMPWELMTLYTPHDYAAMKGKVSIQPIDSTDRIRWMRCPSLFSPGDGMCIPAQLLFTGLRQDAQHLEKLFSPGFSKGAAAHSSLKKALKSAILESIEADAFMIRWYTKKKSARVLIDDPVLQTMITEMLGELDIDVDIYQYSLPEMPGHVFGVGLLNRKQERPIVTLGCSAGLNPGMAIYRALVEALAIYYLGSNGPILAPDAYFPSLKERDYTDLDSNVALWANSDGADRKRMFMRSLIEGEVKLSELKDFSGSDDDELEYLLQTLQPVAPSGVYFDMTPPEVSNHGWHVIRVFFPELVQMSLPAFPYSAHPRLQAYGGIQNELPHPAP